MLNGSLLSARINISGRTKSPTVDLSPVRYLVSKKMRIMWSDDSGSVGLKGGAVTKQHDYLLDLKCNVFLYSLNCVHCIDVCNILDIPFLTHYESCMYFTNLLSVHFRPGN